MSKTHPVQAITGDRRRATAPTCVTMRAYEAYCHIFGEQKAMVSGDCRGGFSSGELVAFLYARTFLREEWGQRFNEALEGLHID